MLFSLQKSTVSFPDRAPLKIRVEVTVKSTPSQIWDVLMDHPRWVEWYEGMTFCEDTSPPGKQGQPGSSRRVAVNGLHAQEEFIALVPGKLWAFSSLNPVPHCVTNGSNDYCWNRPTMVGHASSTRQA